MELGIKGNETHGDEIIKILEMLGGKNRHEMRGSIYNNYFYYIDGEYKDISFSYIGPDEINGYKIFSLDEFLEKFPYKVGDKVGFWSEVDYYGRTELETSEITSMRWNSARCEIAYRLKGKCKEFYKSDIKCKVNDDKEPQIDTSIDYYGEIVKSMNEELAKRRSEIVMETLYTDGITCEFLKKRGFTVPEGYHFSDGSGNIIDATEIRLVKNPPYYPKTYEECCDVLNIPNDERYIDIDVPLDYNKLLFVLTRLLICRDAYWKIAGEWLELDKPWEPDFSDDSPKYNIFKYENEITLSDNNWSNRILVFPTLEMRNAFYDNFKDLIEQCKKLL